MARIDEILAYAAESDVATLVTDQSICTIFLNKAFTRFCGYQEEDLIGRKPGDVLRGKKSSDRSRQIFREGIRDLVPFEAQVRNYRKHTGEEYLAGLYILPFRDEDDPDKRYFIALERELESPGEELLASPSFSMALARVVDLVSGYDV